MTDGKIVTVKVVALVVLLLKIAWLKIPIFYTTYRHRMLQFRLNRNLPAFLKSLHKDIRMIIKITLKIGYFQLYQSSWKINLERRAHSW